MDIRPLLSRVGLTLLFSATVMNWPLVQPLGAQSAGSEICDDTIDNDADGLIDCNDDDCFDHGVCEVGYTFAITRGVKYEVLDSLPLEEVHTFAVSRGIKFEIDPCPPVVDCNGNGIDDSCDLLLGSADLIDATGAPNPNGIPDECDLTYATFLRGDVDGLPGLQIGDAIANFNYLTTGFIVDGKDCQERYDVNGDLALDVADVVWTISYLFLGGPPPAAPFPNCDSTGIVIGALGCTEANCVP